MPSSYSRIRLRSRRRRFLVVVSIIEMIYNPRRRMLGLRIAVQQPELEGVDAVPSDGRSIKWIESVSIAKSSLIPCEKFAVIADVVVHRRN